MCNPASFVLTKDSVFWSALNDAHEAIIAEHALVEMVAGQVCILRVEISPPDGDMRLPLDSWVYRIDQDIVPAWADVEKDVSRARAALQEWAAAKLHREGECIVRGGQHYANDCASVTAYGDANVTAYESASVTANDCASVMAYGDASVTANDCASVTACGGASVTAHGRASVRANGGASVRAYESASVTAYESASVTANDCASVRANGGASVTACDCASVTAYGRASVTACGGASVRAYESASVTANDCASVVANDCATIIAYRVGMTAACLVKGSDAVLIDRSGERPVCVIAEGR